MAKKKKEKKARFLKKNLLNLLKRPLNAMNILINP